MTYLLDSNILIEAKNRYYRFDTVPGFWEAIDSSFKSGAVASINAVYKELVPYRDDLSRWVIARKEWFLTNDDEDTQR